MGSLETLPERLARVEGCVDEHSRGIADIAGRFTNLEGRIDRFEANVDARFVAMEANVNARFQQVDARLDHLDGKIDEHFKWTIGLILAIGVEIAGVAAGLAFKSVF